jgi:hypothetical protein
MQTQKSSGSLNQKALDLQKEKTVLSPFDVRFKIPALATTCHRESSVEHRESKPQPRISGRKSEAMKLSRGRELLVKENRDVCAWKEHGKREIATQSENIALEDKVNTQETQKQNPKWKGDNWGNRHAFLCTKLEIFAQRTNSQDAHKVGRSSNRRKLRFLLWRRAASRLPLAA